MEITVQKKPGLSVMIVTGKIEPDDTEVLLTRLNEVTQTSALLLDLAGVQNICSTALGILISQHRKLRRAERDLKMVVEEGHVKNLLHVTMLDRVIPLFGNREAALRTFATI